MSLYVVVACSLAIGVGFVLLFRRLIAARECDVNPTAWLEEFNLDAYAPLERLLNDEPDFQFLASQAGYRPEIERELRRERRAIRHGYLERLAADFRQLVAVAKFMAVYAPEDRGQLRISFWRCELSFYGALTMAHLTLALYPLTQRWDSRPALGRLTELYHTLGAARPKLGAVEAV